MLVITPHSPINQKVAWLNLLSLAVRPESELAASSQAILARRGIPMKELRHTSAAQDWLEAGRQAGPQLRPPGPRITIEMQTLPMEKVEELAEGAAFAEGVALLDFQGPDWLAANAAANPDA